MAQKDRVQIGNAYGSSRMVPSARVHVGALEMIPSTTHFQAST